MRQPTASPRRTKLLLLGGLAGSALVVRFLVTVQKPVVKHNSSKALLLNCAVKPRGLCPDEPLSLLDDETRAEMHALLRSVHAQTRATILHVTHHAADAPKLASRILWLKNGEVAESAGQPG